MDFKHLKRVLELVDRTGDRVVYVDEKLGNPMVILGIDAYEQLAQVLHTPVYKGDDVPVDYYADLQENSLTKPKNEAPMPQRQEKEPEVNAHLTTPKPSAILEPAPNIPNIRPVPKAPEFYPEPVNP